MCVKYTIKFLLSVQPEPALTHLSTDLLSILSKVVFKVGVHINDSLLTPPKLSQRGKLHIIVDISHSSGEIINYMVDPTLWFLSYSSVDKAAS